jgi:hypothetical protein
MNLVNERSIEQLKTWLNLVLIIESYQNNWFDDQQNIFLMKNNSWLLQSFFKFGFLIWVLSHLFENKN